MFASSHWKLEAEATVAGALLRLRREQFPAIFCGAGQWEKILAEVPEFAARPTVIALAENPGDKEWLAAINRQVYVLDVHRLHAPELFSVLSHAWRASNETGL